MSTRIDPAAIEIRPLREVTQSSMRCFLECPQKYVLRYIMWLVPKKPNIAFITGNAFHAGMEALLSPKAKDPLSEAEDAIDAYFETASESMDVALMADEELWRPQAQVHAMLKSWFYTKADDLLHTYEVLAVEQVVRCSDKHDDPIDRVGCKLDAMLVERGRPKKGERRCVYVLEHKSRSNQVTNNFVAALDLDTQGLVYVRRASRAIETGQIDVAIPKRAVVGGFIYNTVVKPQHRTGDYDQLTAKMQEAMCADPARYFAMIPVLVDTAAVVRHEANWNRIIQAMDSIRPGNICMNTTRCGDYNGCPYAPLCANGADANDPKSVFEPPQIEAFRTEQPHIELEE